MYYKTTYKSPLGILYLVSDEENLIGLWLEGQKYFQATLKEEPIINDQIKILQETKSWLERYFKGHAGRPPGRAAALGRPPPRPALHH